MLKLYVLLVSLCRACKSLRTIFFMLKMNDWYRESNWGTLNCDSKAREEIFLAFFLMCKVKTACSGHSFFSVCVSDGALLYANTGHNVTLPCFYASDSAKHLCWYKQVAGERPQIISSFYKHSPDTNSFHNQFKGDKRFSVHAGRGFYHLNISNVQSSDSAAYYCGQISVTVTEFNNGIFLVVKGRYSGQFAI